MCERIGTSGYNPLTERERLEPFFRNNEPDEDDDICSICNSEPCRCDELDAINDALEARGVPVEKEGAK